jgi:FkbM family methyltransferase
MSQFNQEVAASQASRRTLVPFARAILTVTPQGVYAVPVEDMYVGVWLRQRGCYNPEELNVLRSMCDAQTRLLVVGAHIGALAIPLAKTCRSVVAVEANPQTSELLQLNVSLNNLTNCKVIRRAASNQAGQIEFVMNRSNSGGSKRKPAVHLQNYFYDNPEVVKVEAGRLDDLLAGEEFDVVLMDIEGSEYFALQGMQRILASVGVLQVEFLPHHLLYVAAVPLNDFVSVIAPHFASLFIPTKGLLVPQDQFAATLGGMYDRGEGDQGLIFLKAGRELPFIRK